MARQASSTDQRVSHSRSGPRRAGRRPGVTSRGTGRCARECCCTVMVSNLRRSHDRSMTPAGPAAGGPSDSGHEADVGVAVRGVVRHRGAVRRRRLRGRPLDHRPAARSPRRERAVVGVVTGVGEAAALALRLVSGPLTDRTGRFWAWTIAGYAHHRGHRPAAGAGLGALGGVRAGDRRAGRQGGPLPGQGHPALARHRGDRAGPRLRGARGDGPGRRADRAAAGRGGAGRSPAATTARRCCVLAVPGAIALGLVLAAAAAGAATPRPTRWRRPRPPRPPRTSRCPGCPARSGRTRRSPP